ncbi:branched-chain amino acid ABC transporter permease [Pseudoroseomonas deserti]|uniref:Branched-chain amino acid ABC transporter permease n=1 Tax=Teichococcus deserti TaxID=1817963 RepID=A0A1V2H2U0_9PROT|nr:branched-chain amino acid ABC transporter permease [Pseudoroseomonas deserti]ONG54203.1 branched-chain amino acid ABC transporter permease [Pseudoroseomonas deserti]
MLFLQLLVSGIQTGAIYALTAAGFALIFGATRVFHVAHGAAFALAGYSFLALSQAGFPWFVGAGAALVVAVAFGLFMDFLVYRPIQRHEGSFFTVFVAAFGMSIVVQSLIELGFGRGFVVVASPLTRAHEVLPGLYLADIFWVAVGVALLLFGAVTLFLERTRIGIGLRALSENPELLRAFGLSSRRLSMVAFGLGSALAVPGAVLTAMTSGLQPAIAAQVMLVSLAAAVVGGIGSLRGAALAGLLLGVVENLVVSVLDTQWSAAAGFVVLFAFILFKPSGLFGQAVAR